MTKPHQKNIVSHAFRVLLYKYILSTEYAWIFMVGIKFCDIIHLLIIYIRIVIVGLQSISCYK